jgi:hypothetical protein
MLASEKTLQKKVPTKTFGASEKFNPEIMLLTVQTETITLVCNEKTAAVEMLKLAVGKGNGLKKTSKTTVELADAPATESVMRGELRGEIVRPETVAGPRVTIPVLEADTALGHGELAKKTLGKKTNGVRENTRIVVILAVTVRLTTGKISEKAGIADTPPQISEVGTEQGKQTILVEKRLTDGRSTKRTVGKKRTNKE